MRENKESGQLLHAPHHFSHAAAPKNAVQRQLPANAVAGASDEEMGHSGARTGLSHRDELARVLAGGSGSLGSEKKGKEAPASLVKRTERQTFEGEEGRGQNAPSFPPTSGRNAVALAEQARLSISEQKEKEGLASTTKKNEEKALAEERGGRMAPIWQEPSSQPSPEHTWETPARLYEGETTDTGPCGFPERIYGKIRQFYVHFMRAETGNANLQSIQSTLNLDLEGSSNIELAIYSAANKSGVEQRTVIEHVRQHFDIESTEEWDLLWKQGQNGYIKSRGATRRAAKQLIAREANCPEDVALLHFHQNFKTYGIVEEAMEAAVATIRELTLEMNELEETPQTLAAPAMKPQTSSSKEARAAEHSLFNDRNHPVSKRQVVSATEPDVPEREPTMSEDVEFTQWRTRYETSMGMRGSNPNPSRPTHSLDLPAEATKSEKQAKSSAVEAIAAVTARDTAEVERELDMQLKRYKETSDAIRATVDILTSQPPPVAPRAMGLAPTAAPADAVDVPAAARGEELQASATSVSATQRDPLYFSEPNRPSSVSRCCTQKSLKNLYRIPVSFRNPVQNFS